jgi:hypothetical protein
MIVLARLSSEKSGQSLLNGIRSSDNFHKNNLSLDHFKVKGTALG